MPLTITFSGNDLNATFTSLRQLLPQSDPKTLSVDHKPRGATQGWADELAKCQVALVAEWNENARIVLHKDRIVRVPLTVLGLDVDTVLQKLTEIPFEIASTGELYDSWSAEDGNYPRRPAFADMHGPHGWACFFKGEGHRRLVSRRWLDFGPWRHQRSEADVSLVQFHDVTTDASTAFEQAREGHNRMGISPNGGFIQSRFVYRHKLDGLYHAASRTLELVINGRAVSQREMLDACAARLYQALGPDKPVDHVRYTFVREEEARAHLHELWLRELECWAIIAGREARLDVDYHPSPSRPDWVAALKAERQKLAG
jgi:hypothetical protein